MVTQNETDTPYANLGKQVLVGSAATMAFVTGEKLMIKLSKHPLLVFGLGMLGGVLIYKNRKAILANTDKVVAAGKNTVLHQKERILDLVAEVKEERT